MRYKLITLAAAALAASTPAVAAKERIVDVTALDVAGVRLGMTPSEARVGLEAAGFNVSDDQTGPSWTARIAEEAGKYVNTPRDTTRGTHYTYAEGPDFQTVEVSYDVGPRGSRVRKVKYTRPADRGNILPTAIAKYGEPTVRRLNGLRYCSAAKECNDSFMSDMPSASIEAHQSNTSRSFIIMSQGDAADGASKATFDKAVRDIAPNYGKAAF